MNRKKMAHAASLSALFVAILSGCGAPHIQLRSAYVYDTTIVVATARVSNLNPVTQASDGNQLYDELVFQPLLGLNPHGGAIPDLAKTWQSSQSGLTWHITLNPFAKWWTGRPVTARDVAWTIDYYKNPASGFRSVKELANIRSIQATSATVLTIRLAHRDRDFAHNVLSARGGLWILPSFLLDRLPIAQVRYSEYLTNLKDVVGDGPFRPIRWTSTSLSWTAYPHFFLGAPHTKYMLWEWRPSATIPPVDLAWSHQPLTGYDQGYRRTRVVSPRLWFLVHEPQSPVGQAALAALTNMKHLPGVSVRGADAGSRAQAARWLTRHGYRFLHNHWIGPGKKPLTLTLYAPAGPFARALRAALTQQWRRQGLMVQPDRDRASADLWIGWRIARPVPEPLAPNALALVRSPQYWYIGTRLADVTPNPWQPFYNAEAWRMRFAKKR